ncbi:myelin-associated glycoprotein-like [Arapaima gigas]
MTNCAAAEKMGLCKKHFLPCCIIRVVSMAILANAQWSVNMPHQITALTGSCVVIPCRFSCPADHRPRDAVWYQYVNRGYPLVYSRNNPGNVIEKFRGKTELVGNVAEKNCSLKIEDVHATQNWEKLYVWIDPDETSFKFYDATVTLEVQVTVAPPEMSVAEDQREGRTIKVSCTAVHTCPPSPPSLSFGDQQGKVEVKHTEEEGGQWRVTAHISWTARAEDHGKKVECTVTHLQNKKATGTIVLRVKSELNAGFIQQQTVICLKNDTNERPTKGRRSQS